MRISFQYAQTIFFQCLKRCAPRLSIGRSSDIININHRFGLLKRFTSVLHADLLLKPWKLIHSIKHRITNSVVEISRYSDLKILLALYGPSLYTMPCVQDCTFDEIRSFCRNFFEVRYPGRKNSLADFFTQGSVDLEVVASSDVALFASGGCSDE